MRKYRRNFFGWGNGWDKMDEGSVRELQLKIKRLHAAGDALHEAAAAAAGIWSGEAACAHLEEEAEAYELLEAALKLADEAVPDSEAGRNEAPGELLSSFLL